MTLEAAFARCRTAAEFYRVQIEAENRLTPREVAALHARSTGLPDPARQWVAKLAGAMWSAAPRLAPHERRQVAPHVTLYAAGPPEGRVLLLVLCGQAPRPMLPVPLFLQHLPAGCDAALLWDPGLRQYLRGIEGYAEDLPGLALRLRDDLGAARFAGLGCLGLSSGGAAALALGRLLGASQAVAVGGAHPAWRPDPLVPVEPAALDRALAEGGGGATRIVCAFGAAHPDDPSRAESLKASFPDALLVPVAEVAQHNLLFQLQKRRTLARFLETVATGRFEPGVWR